MTFKPKLHKKDCTKKIFGAYLCLNFSKGLLQIFHIFVCNFSRDFLTYKCIENFKKWFLSLLAHVTPSIFFSRFFRSEALVSNSYFFQNSHSTEIIGHQLLIQTLQFLTRLPTRQDGVENRDKVYIASQSRSQLIFLEFIDIMLTFRYHIKSVNLVTST